MDTLEPNPALEEAEPQSFVPVESIIDRPIPLWKKVLLLALPVCFHQFLHLLVNLSDGLLLGRFLDSSQTAIVAGQAAQTTANYLYWFITNIFILVSAGSTALVARMHGAKDIQGANRVTNQSLSLGLLCGVAASVLFLVGNDALMWLLQLRGEAAIMAADYLRPIFIALPLQMIQAVGIACLIGAGDTVTGMWVMSGVALLNLPLSWALCQGWWPFPMMGFVGISAGTAISHSLGCLAILAFLLRGKAGLRLNVRQLKLEWNVVRRVLRISVPAGIDSMSLVAGQMWFLGIINQLGTTASAAHGVALRWEALGYLSGAAFGVAATALVGQYLGAGKPQMAARSGWTAFLLGGAIMCVMGIVFYVLAQPMFILFCPKPEQQPIVEMGVPVLQLIAWAMPGLASCIIFTGALRGAGDTRVPVLFTWFGFLAVRIPLAYWLIDYWQLGLLGGWLAMFADLLVRGALFLARFGSSRWKAVRV